MACNQGHVLVDPNAIALGYAHAHTNRCHRHPRGELACARTGYTLKRLTLHVSLDPHPHHLLHSFEHASAALSASKASISRTSFIPRASLEAHMAASNSTRSHLIEPSMSTSNPLHGSMSASRVDTLHAARRASGSLEFFFCPINNGDNIFR